MKLVLVLAWVSVCAGAAAGCGDTATRVGSTSPAAATGTATSSSATNRATDASPVVAHLAGRLLGDEDDDDQPGHYTPSKSLDSDADLDVDSKHANTGYLDFDDGIVADFGRPASAADARSATAFVKHYFAAAAAEDGAAGCSMLYRTYADTVVEDDGSSASPPYQRGNTCAIVMSKIFTHLRAELTAPAEVVAVRVDGPMAYVLLGSTTRPASYVRLHREGGAWKLYGEIQRPLP
jgi:hypothetical protein